MITESPRRPLENIWSPIALIVIVAMVVALGQLSGAESLTLTINEMLIRMVVVIGVYTFVGNTGIVSFGQVAFMCIGAYAAGWAAGPPAWKQLMLTGLPAFLSEAQYPFIIAVLSGGLLAAVIAALFGAAIIRLTGTAASIATFAFLAAVNGFYSNWDSVTAGTSSIIGIPTVANSWVFFAYVAFAIICAAFFQQSRVGLMVRASRDDEVAAKSVAINVVRVRLSAFVLSAFLVGLGGGLYAHFLGVITVDVFYLNLTFLTLAMLIIGGSGSLSGAVIGTLFVTLIVELLRKLEAGVTVENQTFELPRYSQEIGLGIVLALVLVLRPGGLTNGSEIPYPLARLPMRPSQNERERLTSI
jgi:branched-chain amino acid transport system permease protein